MCTQTTKHRTNSIDLFRYVCAIMVVIIHSSFWASWGKFGFFVGHVFPRIAVPFFFAVSGYFYIKALENGKAPLLKQVKHLFSIYTFWSLVYLLPGIIHHFKMGGSAVWDYLKNYMPAAHRSRW